jgi:hypothetical protein
MVVKLQVIYFLSAQSLPLSITQSVVCYVILTQILYNLVSLSPSALTVGYLNALRFGHTCKCDLREKK